MVAPRQLASSIGVLVLVAAIAAQAQDQYLVNPGFESLDADGSPKAWDRFVLPREGAYAQTDVLASDGKRSVMLHVPTAYDIDPANNWSQVIYGDFAGQTLTATVNAYAEDGARPALWLQCFRKSPLRVLAAADSSQSNNNADRFSSWTRMSVSVDAPRGTDFVIVRCVIKGAGTVWFDEATLRTDSGDADTLPDVESVEEPPEPLVPSPVSELEEIRRQMQSALDELRDSNTRLRGQIATLETELQTFRDQLATVGKNSAPDSEPAAEETQEPESEPRHILLPREP